MTPTIKCNPKFFVLQTGDIIIAGDEYYNPTIDLWLSVELDTIGDEWNDDESKPLCSDSTTIETYFVNNVQKIDGDFCATEYHQTYERHLTI